MTNYCLLDETRKNVLDGPKRLPVNWKNISNLPALLNDELKKLAWLPVVYPELVFDSATQKRLADTLTINGNQVDVTFNIENKMQEELDADVAAIVLAESTAYIQQRADAHIPIGDQLNMQYWDLVNSTTTWKDYVTGINKQFPKPE